jgi:hypothetical protein
MRVSGDWRDKGIGDEGTVKASRKMCESNDLGPQGDAKVYINFAIKPGSFSFMFSGAKRSGKLDSRLKLRIEKTHSRNPGDTVCDTGYHMTGIKYSVAGRERSSC